MRAFARLAIVAFAVFAAAPPAAAQMEGSYDLMEINGQAVPVPSPGEDGVVMSKMSLVLTPEGRFVLQFAVEVAGFPQRIEEVVEGTFTVAGDTLAITSQNREDVSTVHFRFALADGTLRLYDYRDDEYTLRRRR